jgi:two-component system sensor kinase FixL
MGTTNHGKAYRTTMGEGRLPTLTTEPISRIPIGLSKPVHLRWSDSPALLRYGIAVLSVLVALLVARWLEIHLVTAPVSLFLCAIMLSAWFGGLRPGLFAVAISLLAFDYYFVLPVYSMAMEIKEAPRFIIFALSALFVGALSAAQRSATESIRNARDDLSRTVLELKRTNEALQTENIERKRAEDVLREQASLLDLTHDTVFARDMGDVITYWNRGAEEMYGWTREEAIGKVTHQLTRTIFPAPLAGINAELLRTGRWEGELVHTKRDGTQVVVASRWSLQRDEQGEPAAILETNNDITERKLAMTEQKRAAEALRQAQADLAHVSRVTTMGELTASLAHEVNQPITAAVTNANTCARWLAGDSPNIEEAREAAMRSAKNGTRAADIISRIRLLFQKGTPKREPVNINEVIREIIILLRSEATRYSVSVRTELGAGLPELMGDPVQLQQVFMNLLLNGIEAMKDVDDQRELFIKSQLAEDEQLLISIGDTGGGLPPQADRIFDAFFTTKLHGTGMGLSISRSIVESHGGRLWADEDSPRGSTFHIALPTRVEAP